MNISAGFLKGVFGSEKLAYNQLLQMVDKVLALYKILYVSIGDASLLKAFSALEYVFNVEAYFNIIGGSQGKTVFNNYRDDFLKRFNSTLSQQFC